VREIACGTTIRNCVTRRANCAAFSTGITGLKPIFRTVFVLRDVRNCHRGDGRGVGLSVAAVKSRLLRARLQLRRS